MTRHDLADLYIVLQVTHKAENGQKGAMLFHIDFFIDDVQDLDKKENFNYRFVQVCDQNQGITKLPAVSYQVALCIGETLEGIGRC